MGRLPRIAWGKGSYVYDASGKRYIDGSGGPALFCIGHGNEEVNQAILGQLGRIAHGYRYHFTSEAAETLQSIVSRRAGEGLTEMVFVSSGSEAVESCLKVALQYQAAVGQSARRRFIARRRAWHGNTLGALSVSHFDERREPFEGALLDVRFVSAPNAYRPPAGLEPGQLAEAAAAELETAISELGPENVCAFIFEPVMGAAGGAVPTPPGYARRVREICTRYGVLLIADEVMCGAGRTGTWRALEHEQVVPDLMAVAKGLAGGYLPLGAAVYRKELMAPMVERYGAVRTGHTFTAHTTACAAGVAVQEIIERERLVEKVATDAPYLFDALRDALAPLESVGDIRGRGFFVGIELVRNRVTKTPFDPERRLHERIFERALANGLICYPVGGNVDGRAGDHVILAPPYNASRAELDEIVEKLTTSIRESLNER